MRVVFDIVVRKSRLSITAIRVAHERGDSNIGIWKRLFMIDGGKGIKKGSP